MTRPCGVVITGASRGLGAALARAYAAPGINLGLIARNAGRLAIVAEECAALGATSRTAVCDVTDSTALSGALSGFDNAATTDLLIANAGIEYGPAPAAAAEDAATFARVIATNLLGAACTIQAILPSMLARGSGHIALITSVAAYRGLPDSPAYCASKAGLRLYGESLRARVARQGVTVSVVMPGFFHSAMTERFIGSHSLIMPAEAMALRIRQGLDRRLGRIVVPRRLGLLMQMLDFLPAALGDCLVSLSRFQIDNAAAAAAEEA